MHSTNACGGFVINRTDNRIAELRDQIGMPQTKLAIRVGTSQQQISQIEAGQKTDIFMAVAICRELNRDLETVFPGLPKLPRLKTGSTKVEQLTAANLELQDNLAKALAVVTRLRPLVEAANSPEEKDPSYGWRDEPHEVGPRMFSASPAKARRLAQSILSREQALRHAFNGSLPELAQEILKSDPERAKPFINSLGLLAQELQAVIGGDKGQAQAEATGVESKSKRQRRAAASTG